MAELLEPGQRVEYLVNDEWLKGVVHGVKTHELPDGRVTKVAYLIDTGETVREDIGHEPTGKLLHNQITGEKDLVEYKEVTIRQPEQTEVDQDFVKPVL